MSLLARTTSTLAASLMTVAVLTTTVSAADSSRPNDRAALATNLAGVTDWSTEMPFVDLFWRARNWISQSEGKPWGQGPTLERTPEGWVARLAPGQYATTILSGGAHPAGRYTCTYDGQGTLRFWGDVRDIQETPGRVTFDSQGKDSLYLDLRATDPNDPVRDIRVLMPGFETTDASTPFYPHFLERTSQFRALRFMDWMETNNSRIRTWDDRPKPTDFSQATRGVALEHMITLANTLHADPWFCMPHLADDEFIRQFAIMVKDQLDPGLKVFVEHSNEVWNGQFAQAQYAAELGTKLGLSDNRYQAQLFYHARRSREIFALWEEVFGGTDRLVRVLASHSANPWASEQVLAYQDAAQHADALAIAPYFGHALGNPKSVEDTLKLSVEEVLDRCEAMIRDLRQPLEEQARLAGTHGLDLIAYEGGQHLVGHGGAENNEALTELLHAANRHPRMEDLYRQYLDLWKESGGKLFAVFSSVSAPSKWGSWGFLEFEHQDPADAPKYRAIVAFLRDQPAWWTEED